MSEGHLFVVNGKLEAIKFDAAIVPVSDALGWNSGLWAPLVGDRPGRPNDWLQRRWGRVGNTPRRVWAVSISANSYDEILPRINAVLARVSERRDVYPKARGEGTLPLVAVPVIGIGRGGFSADRGAVLRSLVSFLSEAARAHNVDVALVASERSVYSAAQYARKQQGLLSPLRPDLEEHAAELGRAAAAGQLALFFGAGVGMAAGLPSWDGLLQELATDLNVPEALGVGHLTATDQAELIERRAEGRFQLRVAEIIAAGATFPSLVHGLLASLDCRQVVTTNYDLLYDVAAEAAGQDLTSVLPWNSAHGAERWILKLHGDCDNPSKIVLTRRHMLKYDAANRPSGSLLQSLLLTKKLLMVGLSMTDDNVIRLAHEVQEYRVEHQKGDSSTFGTVLDASTKGDSVRSLLWDGQLDWVQLAKEDPRSPHRTIELVLDRVAFHGSRESSWVLDERFDGLLSDHDRELAQQARELFRRIGREGTKWDPLRRTLQGLGASSADR